jgi:hypothetical protein
MKGGFNMAVQELVQGSQRTAAWAKQARGFVEDTIWIKIMAAGIETKQEGVGSQGENKQDCG